MIEFQELNTDQRREAVNTQQRHAALREAQERAKAYRGSMVWAQIKGRDYLARSHYDKSGLRRQTSLGPRSTETEAIKLEFDRGRDTASKRLEDLQAVIERQAAINRAIGLGRIPLIGARIIRALDDAGMLGSGIRVLGTNAVYAYEAAAGVRIDPGLTSTEDIDLLFDARGGLTFEASEAVSHPSLLHLLRKVDRSFERTNQTFRAANSAGYLVDLIKPLRDPPWADDNEPKRIGTNTDDLTAAEIEGLAWHESAPSFEAIAIDEKGEPCRIVATDPRVWAAHKLWLSKREDREPLKRRRDEAQAEAIGRLVADYLSHLPYTSGQLQMLPKRVFEEGAPLFTPSAAKQQS
jgi:hypothetical protein